MLCLLGYMLADVRCFYIDYLVTIQLNPVNRKRAEEVFKEQMHTVEKRKRQNLLERLTELKHDDDLISRNKSELV